MSNGVSMFNIIELSNFYFKRYWENFIWNWLLWGILDCLKSNFDFNY